MTQKYKILAADKLAQEGLDFILSQPDAELVNQPGLGEDELARIVGQHDGMIVRSGVQVTAKVLEHPGRLRAVARAGVGVDNIDLETATAKGVLVMNSAEASTLTTAEHAFTLMLALARRIGPAYMTMAQGGWDRGKFKGVQLAGKTLGVIGFGRIGRAVAQRALAFDMKVIAHDPFYNAATALDGQVKMYSQLEELVPSAHILTMHLPLNDQTRGLIGTELLTRCPKGVMIVNAARGGIVDEPALLEAVQSGQCGGAALDVFATEPLAADSPLRDHPKILVTPHLGASTAEAQRAVSVDAATALLAYLRGNGVHGAVNAGGLQLNLDPTQQRFVDLTQRMARLISPMITEGIGQVTVELSGQALASAAATIERMSLIELLREHLDVPLNIVNVRHVAESRGISLRTVIMDDDKAGGPQLAIRVDSRPAKPGSAPQTRCIVGRVYDDQRPRIVEINGYCMDMVPSGVMVLIQNQDQPGMVGMVGGEFGQARVNIADMAISRRDTTALMVLKIDTDPPESLLHRLRHRPGILKVAIVKLPPESPEAS